jgi:hypothetical protein
MKEADIMEMLQVIGFKPETYLNGEIWMVFKTHQIPPFIPKYFEINKPDFFNTYAAFLSINFNEFLLPWKREKQLDNLLN